VILIEIVYHPVRVDRAAVQRIGIASIDLAERYLILPSDDFTPQRVTVLTREVPCEPPPVEFLHVDVCILVTANDSPGLRRVLQERTREFFRGLRSVRGRFLSGSTHLGVWVRLVKGAYFDTRHDYDPDLFME
jgi:hypothetical protein